MKIAPSDAELKTVQTIFQNGSCSSRNNGDIEQNVVHALTYRLYMEPIEIHVQNVALGQMLNDE